MPKQRSSFGELLALMLLTQLLGTLAYVVCASFSQEIIGVSVQKLVLMVACFSIPVGVFTLLMERRHEKSLTAKVARWLLRGGLVVMVVGVACLGLWRWSLLQAT